MNPIPDLHERILYQDSDLLVINKPHDIPTSGKTLDDPDAVQYWLENLMKQKIWAVHQLDADTSGVNLFVKNKKAVPLFQKTLADSKSKIYLAIVHGVPKWKTMDSHEPIGYISERSLGVAPQGKDAFSRFTVLDSSEEYSLIQAEIFTGRTHQIRIHLHHLGFPLVGDDWYTDQPTRHHFRQALHAWKIDLPQMNLKFCAPLPSDLKVILDQWNLVL